MLTRGEGCVRRHCVGGRAGSDCEGPIVRRSSALTKYLVTGACFARSEPIAELLWEQDEHKDHVSVCVYEGKKKERR